MVQHREACQAGGDIGVVRGKQLFSDAQSFGQRALRARVDAGLICRIPAGGQILRSDQRLARRHQIGRRLKLPCRSLVLQLG